MNSTQASRPVKAIATADWKIIFQRKSVNIIGGTLLALGCLWGFWFWMTHPPKPWIVRWKISHFLKNNATPNVFPVEFAFPSKKEMATTPPRTAAKPPVTKGSRTGKDFDTLASEYITFKTTELNLVLDIPDSQAELQDIKPKLEQLSKQLADAKAAGTTNTVLEGQVDAVKKRIAALEKTVASAPELKKAQDALVPILADLQEFQKAWDEELNTIEAISASKLASARTEFTSDIQAKISDANSYNAIYHLIGQQLWVAERLLGSANPEHRRAGVLLALDAGKDAMNSAANGWLAARICEGYILPNLDLASDANRRSPFNLDNLINECVRIFSVNLEQNNVIRTYKILMAKAQNPAAMDSARAQIGTAYEQSGELKEALSYFRQIKDTNNFRWITWRMNRIQQQLTNR